MKDQVRCANCNGFLGSPWLPIYVDGKGLCKGCSKKAVDAGGKLDRCSKCGDLLTIGDWDRGRKNHPTRSGSTSTAISARSPSGSAKTAGTTQTIAMSAKRRLKQRQQCKRLDRLWCYGESVALAETALLGTPPG